MFTMEGGRFLWFVVFVFVRKEYIKKLNFQFNTRNRIVSKIEKPETSVYYLENVYKRKYISKIFRKERKDQELETEFAISII